LSKTTTIEVKETFRRQNSGWPNLVNLLGIFLTSNGVFIGKACLLRLSQIGLPNKIQQPPKNQHNKYFT
jgi:hypothetical protein